MTELTAVTSPGQVEQVAQLADYIWREHYVAIIGEAQVNYMLEKFQSPDAIYQQIGEGYHYFLIEHGRAAAGYAGVLPEPDNNALFLSKIYVDSAMRGKGVGRDALQQLFAFARQRGLGNVWLTVNKHNAAAISAYERMGFDRTGSVVMDIGNGFVMDDYRMELPLD